MAIRVLYIINDTTCTGGANKSLYTLLANAHTFGIEPIVVCPDRNRIAEVLMNDGYRLYCVPMRNSDYPWSANLVDLLLWVPRLLGRRWLNLRAKYRILSIIKREKIDIVHSNVSVIDVGYNAAKKAHIPHVWHIREYGDLDFHIRYIPSSSAYHYKLRNSYCCCITEDIMRHHGLSVPRARVIYNGIATSTPPTVNFSDRQYLLYAGRVTEDKGFMRLLEGYRLYNGQMPLRVVGLMKWDSPFGRKISSYLQTYNLRSKIQFIGEIADIHQELAYARAVIVPSQYEGFGRILSEAMLVETLTIGMDTAGTHEQFENGLRASRREIGLRFNTPKQLAEAIHIAIKMNESEYKQFTLSAQQTVQKLYNPETNCRQVAQFYDYILHQ